MSVSVKKRLFVSLCSNTMRSGMSFLTGLVIARGLNPAGYGDLTFLLGSFVAIRSLLDLGTANAFYTFISQARRPVRYYTFYGLWLVAQFFITIVVVALLLPEALLVKIWLGHSRPVILLAFAASFFQQQLWQTINQIGEASRKTVKVQYLNVSLAAVYLCAAFFLSFSGAISVSAILITLIVLYCLAALLSIRVLSPFDPAPEPASGAITPGQMFEKYRAYCFPLVALSLVGFAYDFSDKWMLQRFGGANQQGFYQVAYLLASISILATTSTLNIFWKETAEAIKLQNTARVYHIFCKVSRGLFMFGAVLSGFLIPWSGQIVSVFLGKAYSPAGPVLTLMLLYPVHQSLGQIAGTMLLAGERTKQYLTVSAGFMLLSLPISYLMQAPSEGLLVPGLNLGAVG
ncbi:MAG: lipopolysaccharide biosynthesis protein, partial [bacterium]